MFASLGSMSAKMIETATDGMVLSLEAAKRSQSALEA